MKPFTIMLMASSSARSAALQVKNLLFGDLGNRRFVTDRNSLFFDFHVRIGVGFARFVEEKRIADHIAADFSAPLWTFTRPR